VVSESVNPVWIRMTPTTIRTGRLFHHPPHGNDENLEVLLRGYCAALLRRRISQGRQIAGSMVIPAIIRRIIAGMTWV
jgi:hypothetical protein